MNSASTLARLAGVCLSVLLLSVSSESTAADTEIGYRLRPIPFDPAAPQQVRAGQTFALEFSGVWRNSCVPQMIALEGEGARRVLVFQGPPAGSPCLEALTPFEQRLDGLRFDEADVGPVEIALVANGKEWLATHELVVQSAQADAPPVSAFSVDGAWYAPEFSGSGLTLLHQRDSDSDSLVGMWMNFDGEGGSRWYLLAGSQWVSPNRAEGRVFRVSGKPFACTLQAPNPDCEFAAVAARSTAEVGSFALEFEAVGRARLQFSQSDSNGEPVNARTIDLVSPR